MAADTPSSLQTARLFWQRLAPRERAAVTVAAALAGIGLVWGLLLAPALATLRQAERQRADLAIQAQHMQRLAQQANTLKALPQIKTADALRALQTTTQEQLGDAARLTAQGDHVSVTLTRVDATRLAAWLAQARANARASVQAMRLTREAASPVWSGTLSLTLPPS
ncbi:MAG: type II secretion system protein M [Burkholderiaceae bacterium]|jgi:general secretion pathway protein M|nr:type II secretion system protein M [Burkholderiaceae bacterium]